MLPRLPRDPKAYSLAGNHSGKDSLVPSATVMDREMPSSAGKPSCLKKEDTGDKEIPLMVRILFIWLYQHEF